MKPGAGEPERAAMLLNEAARLLHEATNELRGVGHGDGVVYSLPEVAERTGFALRQLTLDCRAGILEHTKRGDFRGMTPRQLELLVSRHAEGGDLAHRNLGRSASNGLAQALEMTRHSGASRTTPRNRRNAVA